MEEKSGKKVVISYQNIINEISKIIRREHLDYGSLRYIWKEVRKKCDLRPIKRVQGAREHLSQEEANKLINYAYQLKGELGLMVKVLLFTGARNNEFVNIEMKDIYLSEKKVYLGKTKGDKPRFVPIFDFYLHELSLYLDQQRRVNGYLFESNRHTKYSTRRVQQIIKRLCKEVGIVKKITPHRLRATIATWLKEKGMPTEDIQQFLGHSKLETTQIYTKGAVRDIGDMGTKLLLEKDET